MSTTSHIDYPALHRIVEAKMQKNELQNNALNSSIAKDEAQNFYNNAISIYNTVVSQSRGVCDIAEITPADLLIQDINELIIVRKIRAAQIEKHKKDLAKTMKRAGSFASSVLKF